MPIIAYPQEYSVSMKAITVVEISGNLLILAQQRVKYINIKNAEAEKISETYYHVAISYINPKDFQLIQNW